MSDKDESDSSVMEISWAGQLSDNEGSETNNSDKTKESGKQKPDNENKAGTSHPATSPTRENKTGKSHPVIHPNNSDEKRKAKTSENEEHMAKRARSELRRKSDTSTSYDRETRGRSTSTSYHKETRGRSYSAEKSKSQEPRRSRANYPSKNKTYPPKNRTSYPPKPKSTQPSRNQGSYSKRDDTKGRYEKGREKQHPSPNNDIPAKFLEQVPADKLNEMDLNTIKTDDEDHYIIIDQDIPDDCLVAPLVFYTFPTSSMREMVYYCKTTIEQAARMKQTYITISIFQRFMPTLGVRKICNIANTIADIVISLRHQLRLPEKERNPKMRVQQNIFNVHVAFATLHYPPALEYMWPEIRTINYRLKQINDRLETNHINIHKWVTKPVKGGRIAVKGNLYTEFCNKENLGLNLNESGMKQVVKGFIRHHVYGITGERAPASLERQPIALEITGGYLMNEKDTRNVWVDTHMAVMAAKNYQANQDRQANNPDAVIEEDMTYSEEEIIPPSKPKYVNMQVQTENNDYEEEIKALKAKVIALKRDIENKEHENSTLTANEEYLQQRYTTLVRQQKESQDKVVRKLEKYESLCKEYQQKIKNVDKEVAKANEKVDFYKQQYDRDQDKIDTLSSSLRKVTNELREEKDMKSEDVEKLEEEIKYLRIRVKEDKEQPNSEAKTLREKNEKLERELSVERELTDGLNLQIESLVKQIEALKKRHENKN